jgi:hypothetical protein
LEEAASALEEERIGAAESAADVGINPPYAPIAQINSAIVEDARLEEFLFGASRIDLEPVRRPLHDLQEGRCFYCDNPIGGVAHVDHFLPWARHPDDGIDNLVATDVRCNSSKRDYLASAEHVERWLSRSRTHASHLTTIAGHLRWERHPDRTHSVARAIYLRLRPEVRLWRLGRDFVPADRTRLVGILGA